MSEYYGRLYRMPNSDRPAWMSQWVQPREFYRTEKIPKPTERMFYRPKVPMRR